MGLHQNNPTLQDGTGYWLGLSMPENDIFAASNSLLKKIEQVLILSFSNLSFFWFGCFPASKGRHNIV